MNENNIIKIEGFVEIRNGDTTIKAKNRFVQTTLQYITNALSVHQVGQAGYAVYWSGPINSPKIYIGTNTTTSTAYNTLALISPIGVVPGTPPTTITGSTDSPFLGAFRMIITAVWDAGIVSGTVGEIALYLNMIPAGNLKSFGWSIDSSTGPYLGSVILASRLAVADGVFSPFTINTANPLVIVWTVQVSFA